MCEAAAAMSKCNYHARIFSTTIASEQKQTLFDSRLKSNNVIARMVESVQLCVCKELVSFISGDFPILFVSAVWICCPLIEQTYEIVAANF